MPCGNHTDNLLLEELCIKIFLIQKLNTETNVKATGQYLREFGRIPFFKFSRKGRSILIVVRNLFSLTQIISWYCLKDCESVMM